MSPVERTLKALRLAGYLPAVVERSIPSKPFPTKVDLFGVADIEALAEDHTLYVQVCRDKDMTDHLEHYLAVIPRRLELLLSCEHRRFELWVWGKRTKAGRLVWSVRRLRAHMPGGTAESIVFTQAAVISSSSPMSQGGAA